MEPFARTARRLLRHQNICHSCLYGLRNRALQSEASNGSTRPSWSAWRRSYHISLYLRQNVNADTQAHPLGDFYAELLAKPIPKESKARTDLPSFVETGGDTTKEERAAKLFGTIKGSGYERKMTKPPDETWQTINGVAVPPRPAEPENCCMSGCVHCVWDDYRDDIEEWAGRLKQAQARAVGDPAKQPAKVTMPRAEVEVASTSMDDDGGGSESLWQSPSSSTDADELFAGIPIGIREFMNVEKKIRERKRERKAKVS